MVPVRPPFSPVAGLLGALGPLVRCAFVPCRLLWAACRARLPRASRAFSVVTISHPFARLCAARFSHGSARLEHRLRACLLRAGAFVVLTLACAFALAPEALATLQNEVAKVTGHMATTAGMVRNFLYGMAVFGLIGIGVAAWFGRVPYKWLFALGGGVFLLALSGLLIDQFIAAPAGATKGFGASMADGGIADLPP